MKKHYLLIALFIIGYATQAQSVLEFSWPKCSATFADIDIYPNPFSDQINIEFRSVNEKSANQQILVEIINVMGVIIQSSNTDFSPRLTIGTSGLRSGAYFIRLSSGGNILHQRKVLK
jgi:hypothetical protein